MKIFQEQLNQIIDAAKHDLTLSLPKGRPKLEARNRFLKDLRRIYEQVTGRTPSVNYSRIEEKFEGQFLDFAEAAFAPIKGHTRTALGKATQALKE